MAEDPSNELNPAINENDEYLFDVGLRISKHLADLSQARFDLYLVEHRRMWSNGDWEKGDVHAVEKVADQLSAITGGLGSASEILAETPILQGAKESSQEAVETPAQRREAETIQAVLLTWNPDKYDWDETNYNDTVSQTAQGFPVLGNWSTGNRSSGLLGEDRVFLLRQGTHGRGIVASGIVTSQIYQDEDWDGSGATSNYVDVSWGRVLPVESALPTEVLKEQLPEINWDRLQMSGTIAKPELVPRLVELWSRHLKTLNQ